jgi:hypothetical protein
MRQANYQGDIMTNPHGWTDEDTVTAPSYWVSALINGDYSGLQDDPDEVRRCEEFAGWMTDQGIEPIGALDDTLGFTNRFHCHGFETGPGITGGETIELTILAR